MIIRFPSPGAKRYNALDSICSKCLRTPSTFVGPSARRTLTAASSTRSASLSAAPRLRTGYFLYNAFLEPTNASAKFTALTSSAIDATTRPNGSPNSLETSISNKPPNVAQDLPHRRRQRARQEAAAAESKPEFPSLPPDASSSLTTLSSRLPTNSARRLFSTLLSLSKPRLSFLIVLTTTSAYSLYPVPALLSPSITDTPSLSALTLFFLTVGTSLTCSSANTLNMLYEPKWDALMSRTKNRPLVRGLISPRAALVFAILTGATGVAALYYGVNPTVAFLGGFNICLYAGVYTPLKRVSAINTWVGAIVGGIPPLMGWAAAAGQNATGTGDWQSLLLGEQSIGGWLLAGLLFAWQFPHFMALSWPIREEYKLAGHQMLCWTNPSRNGRVALRYSLLFMPICVALCYVGVTEWSFAVASVPVNVWLARQAWRFWKYEGFKGSARGLFWASVWHLPVLMVLAMVEKKGLWGRVWRAVVGEPEDEDDGEWVDEDEDGVQIDGATHPVIQTALLSR